MKDVNVPFLRFTNSTTTSPSGICRARLCAGIGTRGLAWAGLMLSGLTAAHAQTAHQPMVYEGTAGGPRLLEEGMPPAMVHPTVGDEIGRAHV